MSIHPIVQKYLDGQLPEPMIQSLLGGGLPIPPLDLLQALSHAIFKETPHLEKAQATLLEMPEGLLQSAIVGPVEPPDPLGLICCYRQEATLLETALLHENLTPLWMERVVPHLPGSLLDIVLNNQLFWMERPGILDAVEGHPAGEYNHRRRITEYRRDVLHQIDEELAKERQEVLDAVEAGHLDPVWAILPLPDIKGEADAVEQGPPPAVLDDDAKAMLDAAAKEVEAKYVSVTARLLKATPNQKAILAIKGGKEERVFLIRESNRIIQVNVIKNPRITEQEVQYIAQMRSVNEEVLRFIANNREFMRKYQTVRNLIGNPKTPLAVAMNNLRRLNDFDMRQIARDKNVPEVLRREAGRIVAQKLAKT